MIRLILHLWSKLYPDQSNGLGLRFKIFERAESFLIQWITSRSIDAEPTKHCWHYDACCHYWRNKAWNFSFCFITLLMIRLILYLWSKLHPDQSDGLGFGIQDVWESTQRKASSFNGSHHGRSTLSLPNIGDIMMHDVNIKEKTKTKCQVFSLVTIL